MTRLETHPQAGLFHCASALLQFGDTHAATIVCGCVVCTVTMMAAKAVSNVATNKALMALAPRPKSAINIAFFEHTRSTNAALSLESWRVCFFSNVWARRAAWRAGSISILQLSPQLDDLLGRLLLAISRPCVHQAAALLNGIRATVCLLNLVAAGMR